jgi:type IX secretion system PorP/SprF family membrane protein
MSHVSTAQDIHFTQYNFSPLNENPANTNVFDGDMRFVVNFKNQWQSVPVSYNTVSASMDMNFVTLKNHSKLGGGLLFYYDEAGDSHFSSLNVAYSMSYQLNFGAKEEHTVAFGYQIGFVDRSFDYTKLFFDDQFNGNNINPNLPSGENFSKTNFIFLDMATGITYKWNKNYRTNLTIGGSVAHLNQPSQTFYNDRSVTLPLRFNTSIRGQFKIAEKFDIVPEFLWQRQSTQQEFVPGVHLKSYISTKPNSRVTLNTGAYYRIGDAPAILVGMDYNALQVNCSYDINTSGFTPASRNNGGFEMSLIYIISKVKKLAPNSASCPIF